MGQGPRVYRLYLLASRRAEVANTQRVLGVMTEPTSDNSLGKQAVADVLVLVPCVSHVGSFKVS